MTVDVPTLVKVVILLVVAAVAYGRLDGRVTALEKAAVYYHGAVDVPGEKR